MKNIQKAIAFVLGFSWLYGYLVVLLQPMLGSKIIGNVVSAGFISGILYLMYEWWRICLWKIPVLSDIICFLIGFRHLPNLSGTWNTSYTSSYKTSGNRSKKGSGKVIIEQDYNKISIVDGRFPHSSKFESFFVGLDQKSNGRWFLVYCYDNTPDEPFKDTLGGRHTGFAYLELKDKNSLEGYYATDKLRQTHGEIIFTRC